MSLYKNKKIEYENNTDTPIYVRKEEGVKTLYQPKRTFSRCCKTVSSEPCLCNGEHCMRAI